MTLSPPAMAVKGEGATAGGDLQSFSLEMSAGPTFQAIVWAQLSINQTCNNPILNLHDPV